MGHAITPTATRGAPQAGTSATTQRRKAYIGEEASAAQPSLADLALQIADSTARSDIEVYCRPVMVDQVEWYDTRKVLSVTHPGDRDFIDLALAYLDERGAAAGYRTIRHATDAHLVRFEVDA